MNIQDYMNTVGRNARDASRAMAAASTPAKNAALLAMAAAIRTQTPVGVTPILKCWMELN